MEHLHKHGIIFRDLKPANIGFAFDGKVRLFDFGLARSIQLEDGSTKRLTGATGTARFMAPEVASQQNYGLSADVYSFGLLLWQICSLQKPFPHCTDFDSWFKTAVTLGKRPQLRPVSSAGMKDLISSCWDAKPDTRPRFTAVSDAIEREVMSEGTVSGNGDTTLDAEKKKLL